MRRFATRLQAAEAARRDGIVNFKTFVEHYHGPNYYFRAVSGPTRKPEQVVWVESLDYVAWTETYFKDEGRSPGYKSKAFVTIPLDEIPAEDMARIQATVELDHPIELAPITPSLWDKGDKGGVSSSSRASRATGEPKAPRERSSAESPVKIVWATADAMPGATRQEVVAACVAKGVNAATASTQYYRWSKAQKK